MSEKLDISPLIRAHDSFVKALYFAEELESKYSDDILYATEGGRAAVIQHFEYTYELSWKMMKRFIEMEDKNEDFLTKKDLFRIAGEKGLIDDFHKWVEFHKARNKTAHTYNEDTAKEVYNIAKEFKNYVERFISALEKRTSVM
jgi:nucleotidyltransferase substrate binding protein (TIGR01987 family)